MMTPLVYKKATKRLGIPVHDYGDRLIPEVEMKRFQIIENLLLAGTHGVKNAVFDDGMFTIAQETDNTYVVLLRATGNALSAEGMVDGAYFSAPPTLSWTGLTKGFEHYLYLRGLSNVFEDPSAVVTVSTTHPLETGGVLLAMADCKSDPPKVNPNPDGKVYSEDLVAHICDSENPHGRIMIQDELYVRSKLFLHSPEGNTASVVVMVDGNPVEVPSSALVGAALELAGRKVITVDFTSSGPIGRIVEVPDAGKILFVQVSRRFTGKLEGSLGETAVGYNGEDQQLHLANEFSFCNSGDQNIPLKALVYCG